MRHSFVFAALPVLLLAVVGPVAAQPAEGSLRLIPGGAVCLWIQDEPLLNDDYAIDARGRVLLPLIGIVAVSGRPFSEVSREIETRFAGELADAILVEPLVRVPVLGEVREPGVHPVDPTVTVRALLAAVGGLTPSGDPNDVRLVGERGTLVLSAEAVDGSLDVTFLPGDQLLVGRRSWFAENSPFLIGGAASVLAALVTSLILR